MAKRKFHQTSSKKSPNKTRPTTKDRIQVEGRNPVVEALNADRSFKRILIDRKLPHNGKILEIIKKARGRGIELEFTATGGLNYISETEGRHQGVIAILNKREQKTLKQILEESRTNKKDVFFIILTAAEDERNLGAIIRTASAAGVDAIIVPHMKRSPVTPVVSRASAGAVEHIPVIAESIFQVLKTFSDYGIKIFAVELGGTKTIYDVDLKGDVAIIIGGEDKGISTKIQENCEETLQIPMPGKAQSLNMSVAAALVIYEKIRQEKVRK